MKKTAKRVLVSCCLLLTFLSLQYAYCLASPRSSRTLLHSEAPGFALETIKGKTVALADLKGKGAVLFFFTTWCPYCRQKLPMLSKEYARLQNEDIVLLAIDVGESERKVSSFAAKEGVPFDILLDNKMEVSQDYGVAGVPTFVLISKEGNVVYTGNELPGNYRKLLE